MGRFTQVLLTESEKATPVSESWFIDLFHVSSTVSELFDILFWLALDHSYPFSGVFLR